jgi:hypothetical protein
MGDLLVPSFTKDGRGLDTVKRAHFGDDKVRRRMVLLLRREEIPQAIIGEAKVKGLVCKICIGANAVESAL